MFLTKKADIKAIYASKALRISVFLTGRAECKIFQIKCRIFVGVEVSMKFSKLLGGKVVGVC